MANEEHVQKLKESLEKKSCKLWNQWRKENPSIQVDLSKADLEGLNLKGINLFQANLSEAKLEKTILTEAYLRNANLARANLTKADLTKSFLSKSHLNLANLTDADLSFADLTQTNLRESNLTRANFTKGYLSGAEMKGACAIKANFSEAYLGNADLSEADIQGAIFFKTNLTGAIVVGIKGVAASAQNIICTSLEFHKEKGRNVLEFKDEKDREELCEYLLNENKLLSNLYNIKSKKDRNPLMKIEKWEIEGEEYKILSKIGAGSTGTVYKALTIDQKFVAIKFFEPDTQIFDMNIWASLRRRFMLESARNRRVEHPNVIAIIKRGLWEFRPVVIEKQEKSRPFFIMEYIEGGTLENLLKLHRIPLYISKTIMQKIAQGLYHIHKQPAITEQEFQENTVRIEASMIHGKMAHRNLKPENILIGEGGKVVKISDLGMVSWKDIGAYFKALNWKDSQLNQSIISSMCYMAPEQKENPAATQEGDIFSLGLIFYYLITGTPIDKSFALNKVKPLNDILEDFALQSPWKDLIASMIDRNPKNRPTIKDVLDILNGI